MRRKFLIAILNVAILVGVGYYLWQNLRGFQPDFAQVRYGLLVFSLILAGIYIFIAGWINYRINRLFHIPLSFSKTAECYFGSFLAAYIPGRAFVLLKRHLLFQQHKVPFISVVAVYFTETVASIVGALIFAALAIFPFVRFLPAVVIPVIVFICLAAALSLRPDVLNMMYGYYQKWRGAQEIQRYTVTYGALWNIIGLYFVNWFILAAGMTAFFASLRTVPLTHAFYLAGINALAGVLGIMALIMPNGLGIREGIIVLGFSPMMGTAQAALCAVALRIWTIVAEILSVSGFYLLKKILVR